MGLRTRFVQALRLHRQHSKRARSFMSPVSPRSLERSGSTQRVKLCTFRHSHGMSTQRTVASSERSGSASYQRLLSRSVGLKCSLTSGRLQIRRQKQSEPGGCEQDYAIDANLRRMLAHSQWR